MNRDFSTGLTITIVENWFEEFKELRSDEQIGQAVSAVVAEMTVAITAAVTAATVASTASHS